ncbi:MAG: DUF3024 domain-containing protein [Bacillota bacterium]
MAFNERELKRIDRTVGGLCRRRSRPEHADELRVVYEVDGHAVCIYEERPPWDDLPGEWMRLGVARFRYFRQRDQWQLYWMRRDLKWHLFDEVAPTHNLARLVKVVDENWYGCFFG